MSKVFLDQSMLAKLLYLKEPLELCDESGHALAHVTPVVGGSRYEGVDIVLSDEEQQCIEKELEQGKYFSTAEVLAHLQNLETT